MGLSPTGRRLFVGALWSFGGFALMTLLAVLNEIRPGTRFDDPILACIPYVAWIEQWNYWIWVVPWLLGTAAIIAWDREEGARLLRNSGWLSLLRGVIVLAAGLGPVRGPDVNAGRDWDAGLVLHVTGQILNPLSVFFQDSAQIWLTKDTLMSGHTASTLLLVFHAARFPKLQWTLIAVHVLIVASVLLGHIHYSIDVVVAWVVTWIVFRVTSQRRLRNEGGEALSDPASPSAP